MTKVLDVMREHGPLLPQPENGTDTFPLTSPEGEAFQSCRLTIFEAQHDSGAQITSQPVIGSSQGLQSISVNWWHDGGTEVRYELEAFTSSTQADPSILPPSLQMTGFLPSKNGFHFDNAFPHYPDISLNTPLGDLAFGDASNGLCGGMVFSALDYFNAKRSIPSITSPPTGDVLFNYLVMRLLDSFNLPFGIMNFISLMNPNLTDGDMELSPYGAVIHGRAWRTIREEWPVIKTMLDSGQPCPLGLVRVKSADMKQLGVNHQVLAIGYDVTNNRLTLYIYDPNYHDFDSATIGIDLSAPEQPTSMQYSTGEPLYAFFHVNYGFHAPPQI